jgi:hypothetical protein
MAKRSAHRTGACIALNMAGALGYLDADQQRRVRHALATAINPDADLFLGGRPSLREVCDSESPPTIYGTTPSAPRPLPRHSPWLLPWAASTPTPGS